jgi:cytoskeleton protein RodZ
VFEIGNSLREARLRQGLDFFEIEQSTKIRGKYLRALEDEQFEVLPAQTYVKGFLRSYADHLGLDGQLYVDEFNSRYVRGEFEEEEEEQRPFKPRVARPGRGGAFQSRAVMITLAAIAGLTIFVFVAWISGGSGNQNTLLPLNTNPKQKKAPPKPMANLIAKGVKGGAYVVVYRGARTGKPVYEGTLESGKGHRFIGRHLWVYVFAPANLRLKLNGRSRVVPGAGTGSRRWLEVTPQRVQLANPPA